MDENDLLELWLTLSCGFLRQKAEVIMWTTFGFLHSNLKYYAVRVHVFVRQCILCM